MRTNDRKRFIVTNFQVKGLLSYKTRSHCCNVPFSYQWITPDFVMIYNSQFKNVYPDGEIWFLFFVLTPVRQCVLWDVSFLLFWFSLQKSEITVNYGKKGNKHHIKLQSISISIPIVLLQSFSLSVESIEHGRTQGPGVYKKSVKTHSSNWIPKITTLRSFYAAECFVRVKGESFWSERSYRNLHLFLLAQYY